MYPQLFSLGHLTVPTYGASIAVAIVASLLLAIALARSLGLNPDCIWNLGLLGVVSAMLASRSLLVLLHWRSFALEPRLLLSLPSLQSSGAFAGGIALASALGVAYLRSVRLPLLRTLDLLAPVLSLGQGIASLGCLAAGCSYGRPTHSTWGLVFSSRVAAGTTGVPLGIPLYPTQIFESAASLLICALLLVLLARAHHDGMVMAAGLFLAGTARFYLEFLRGDAGRGSAFAGALTVTQVLAMLVVLLSGVLWRLAARRSTHSLQAAHHAS